MEVNFDELINFTEKQKTARKAVKDYDYVLYGGAVGGGKSYWLRWMMVDLLTDWAQEGKQGVRVGLFCEDYPSLKDRHFSKIQYEFPEWLGSLNKADHEYILKPEYGGGVICFRNLDDPSKYQSSEFAAVAVDELTKNNYDTFLFLRTRKRWPGIEKTKFLAGTNPGGIGHGWVKKMWMDRQFEPNEKEADIFTFIQSRAMDNPHLPSNYYDSLAGLPEEMRRAYVEGDWNLFKGQYFSEWRDDVHTVQPFPIPEGWRKYRAYDYGRSKPACCLWVAQDFDGRLWVYREYWQTGRNANEQAEDINKLSEGEQYHFSVGDSAIFSPTGIVDAFGSETMGETF
jgi:phage terminase large subunit